MSVLIKGIKMPESCLDCPIYDNYHCNLYSYGIPARYNYNPSKRPEWCELEELPEHHGRLIDIDKLMKETLLNPCHAPYITQQDMDAAKIICEVE